VRQATDPKADNNPSEKDAGIERETKAVTQITLQSSSDGVAIAIRKSNEVVEIGNRPKNNWKIEKVPIPE
jgi:hypothetical protein